MRFKSDSQRRACFANLFSNRFSLYPDKKTGNIHSTIYPEVDVEIVPESKIGRKLTYAQVIDALGEIDERDLVGLNKITMLDNTSIAPNIGAVHNKYRHDIMAGVPFVGDTRVDQDIYAKKIHDNLETDEMYLNSPAITIKHEVGHHIDPAINDPSTSLGERLEIEPFAESYSTGRIDPEIKDRLDYAVALQDQKNMTYDDILRYANEV